MREDGRGGCERKGGDKRDRASIERSRHRVLSRRADGMDRRKSTRRDLAIDGARRVAKGRAPRVKGHAPRVYGVCRPCDRRPFRRGVTRIHRRRRRELNATATRAAFFPRARAADTSSVELKSKSRARVSRRGRTRSSPDSRARRARARAPSPPRPHGAVEEPAGGARPGEEEGARRGGRGDAIPAAATPAPLPRAILRPRREKGTGRFPVSVAFVHHHHHDRSSFRRSRPTATDRTRRPEKKTLTLSSPLKKRSVVCSS